MSAPPISPLPPAPASPNPADAAAAATPGAGYRSVFRPGLFAGQLHWVTGGGSGIGRCIAHELAALGASVLISGRSRDKLERVAAEIAEDGGRCDLAAFDIRDEEAVRSQVAAALQRHGRIHGLVNNAGGQFPAPLAMIPKKGFDAVVANNLTGGFLMMREVYAQCMQAQGGAIVNMTADFRNGMPGMGHSGAARAGMSNLSATAAFEWAAAGVRVNAVAPGWVASSGLDRYGPGIAPYIQKLRHAVPLGRLASEAEISAAVVFLLSPAASFISGVTLQIDGAASLGNAAFPREQGQRSQAFEGFHRAQLPEVLR